jgi:MinD-like ATPase involved in chromosome partitioning or flagellar assembly
VYVITFYSFKGGVGRTMALVNVAAELVRRGRKVLVVDFDLEAPGLETYQHLRPNEAHPGIVEYIAEFRRRDYEVPNLLDYVYEGKRIGKQDGRLWVMPAGRRDKNYRNALISIDWKRLYKDEFGFLLFEDLKKGWEEELRPDYVLIDSRTGDTDVLGICTRQLPDSVVLMFAPNEQNLAGLKNVCRDIRDEATQGLKKKIRLHFVASNVPNLDDEGGLLHRQLEAFRKELAIYHDVPRHPRVVIHRYETLELLDQPVFVQQRPRSRLAREYRRLVRRLIMENPVDREGASCYLRSLERDREVRRHWPRHSSGGMTIRAVDVLDVEDRLRQIESQFKDDPNTLLQLARWYQGLGELDLALRQFDSILRLRPGWPTALFERGRCRRQVRDKAGAADDLFLYLQSPNYFPDDEEIKAEEIEGGVRKHKRVDNAMTAIQELLDVSFERFLDALTSPGVRGNGHFCLAREYIWLNLAAEHLLREQRWSDAVNYLETELLALITNHISWPASGPGTSLRNYYEGERAWYLAMARWGQTGTFSSSLCRTSLDLLHPTGHGNYEKAEATSLQQVSLLYWGIGDTEKASALLEQALENARTTGLISDRERGISNWTFREASAHEFCRHCEEMRRMFQGESIQPAFLRKPTARDGNDPA